MSEVYQFGTLEDELVRLCETDEPNWDAIKALIARGANVNAQDAAKACLLSEVIYYGSESGEKTLQLVKLFLESGFDAKKFGLNVIGTLVFSTYDRYIFDAAKLMIRAGATGDEEQRKALLETIGGEESYQRCCDQDHACENIYYAMYELVDRAFKGKHEEILVWHDCVGKVVDAVYADAKTAPAIKPMRGRKCEMVGRIIFQCGEHSVVLEGNPNVYGCDRISEGEMEHPMSLADRLPFCVGAKIADISFYHTEVEDKKKRCSYRQPHIMLTFDTGKCLHFTTNFGEVPKGKTKEYFEVLKKPNTKWGAVTQ